jgi:hypothetical protein
MSNEIHNLYSSLNDIWDIKSRTRLAEHVARMDEMRNAYKIVIGKLEGKRPLGQLNGSYGNGVGRCGVDPSGLSDLS